MNIVFHIDLHSGMVTTENLDEKLDLVNISFNPVTISVDAHIAKQIQKFQEDVRNLLFLSENCLFAKKETMALLVGYFLTVGGLCSDWMFDLDDCLLFLDKSLSKLSSPYQSTLLTHRLELFVERDGTNAIFQLLVNREVVPLALYSFTGEIRKHIIDNILDSL